MGLKERISEKSKALVRRETITLPQCGEVITVRGLMAGDQIRAGTSAPERQAVLFAALGTEDENGNQIWNPNSLDDQREIEALHGEDLSAILTAVRRVSGMDGDAGKASSETKSSGSSSPSATASSPTASAEA